MNCTSYYKQIDSRGIHCNYFHIEIIFSVITHLSNIEYNIIEKIVTINRDLARIQEWCNHWCMILNLNKTKAVVVSRSRTVTPPYGDLVISGVSIRATPNLNILGVKSDSN